MKKAILAIFSIFLLATAYSCIHISFNGSKDKTFFQREKLYDSIVKVENSIEFKACPIKSDGEVGECKKEKTKYSVGSGFAFGKGMTTNTIGTAAHICQMSENAKASLKLRGIMSGVIIKDIEVTSLEVISDDGHKMKAIISASNLSSVDACALKVPKLFPALHLSDSGPIRGKRYYSAGAPLGINGEEMTFLTSGLYSGTKKIQEQEYDWYSIASAGGSSGSAILNEKGEIVGILTMGVPQFKEISISPKFSKIHYFLSKNM